MTRMTDYLVYRHGANAANQSLRDKAPIAIVNAKSSDSACEVAGAHHTRYANQRFSAVPKSRARCSDWNEVVEASEHDSDALLFE